MSGSGYRYASGDPVALTDPMGLFPGKIERLGSSGSCDQGPENPEVTPISLWNTFRAWCFYLACLLGGEEPPEIKPPPPPPVEHKMGHQSHRYEALGFDKYNAQLL